MGIMGYDAMLTYGHHTGNSAGLRSAGSAADGGRAAVRPEGVAERGCPQVGVSVTAAHRWFHAWRAQGRRGLKAAGRAGRKPRLDRAALAKVERALLQGAPAHGFATDLWTLPRVATLIARQTGVQFHPGHVWYLLRALNWSVQRPVRQAQERDEAAITQWKHTRRGQAKT